MKTWASYCGGLLVAGGLATGASGQVPPPPGAPPVPGVPPAAGAAAPQAAGLAGQAGAAPHRLKTFFDGCKEKFCASPFGALVTNTMQPINALTGGMLGNCCPVGPSPADLAKPPTSAQGAAARIQKDEAEAKARRAAVRYLGTVDCNYWPEAEAGLINALRADRNECVRWEAALALGRGCCCTKNVIVALSLTVSGSTADGNPAENSERVLAAAQYALEHCLARLCVSLEVVPGPVIEKEKGEPRPIKEGTGETSRKDAEGNKAEALLPAYYQKVQSRPMKELIEQARKALAENQASPMMLATHRERPRSVTEIFSQAMGDFGAPDKTPGYVAQPIPQAPATANMPPAKPSVEQPVVIRNEQPVVIRNEQPVLIKPTVSTQEPPLAARPAAPVTERPMIVKPLPTETPRPSTNQGQTVRPTEPARNTTPAPTRTSATPAEAPRPAAPAARTVEAPKAPPRPVDAPKQPAAPSSVRPATFQPMPNLDKPAATPSKPTTPPASTTSSAPVQPAAPATAKPDLQVAVATRVQPPAATVTGTMTAPTPSVQDAQLRQSLHTLQKSTYPEHREWAAGQLGGSEMRSHPQVIPALLTAAQQDKEATVRAACVRALGKMNANMPAVVSTLQALKSDTDARVRHEVGLVLAKFGMGPSGFAEKGAGSR